tara:strand:- start:584 stop:778 length:195 start_codon:yes stop_codon:yes gene_type:complete
MIQPTILKQAADVEKAEKVVESIVRLTETQRNHLCKIITRKWPIVAQNLARDFEIEKQFRDMKI